MACITHWCPLCGDMDFNNSAKRQWCGKCGEPMHREFDEPPEPAWDVDPDFGPEPEEDDDEGDTE